MSDFPIYKVSIDKDRDGSFATAGDEVSSDVHQRRAGIKIFRGRDARRSLGPTRAGSATLMLNNASGDYSPGSKVSKGAPIRIEGFHGGGDRLFFTGILRRPQQVGGWARDTQITAVGNISKLVNVRVSTALLENVTTDVAIGAVLDAAGWPAGERDLNTGATTLKYFWADNEEALDAITRICNTEGPGARCGEKEDGYFYFRNRHFILTDISSTFPQARPGTPTHELFEPFSYDDGRENVFNSATFRIPERTVKATEDVWTGPTPVTFQADETLTFDAARSDGQPFKNAVTPVATTDYTVTAGSLSSVTLNRTSGGTVRITITAGGSGATITGLKLRADPVTKDKETDISNTIDASASITEYGPQSYSFPIVDDVDPDFARDLANLIVASYQAGRANVKFTMENHDGFQMTAITGLDLDHLVQVVEPQVGLDDEFFIQSIQILITHGRFRATYTAEQRKQDGDIGIWDRGLWDNAVWGL